MINSEKELLSYVHSKLPLDAIVVEGYDGVGKGRVLSILSEEFGVIPYRPDYNLWQNYDHRVADRWKVSGFFWDVFSHFNKDKLHLITPMLFDRGVISGSVYNGDPNIAKDYKKLLRNSKVLHILVTCSEEDYNLFSEIRDTEDYIPPYITCEQYTIEYFRMFELSDVEYVIYKNKFIEDVAVNASLTCAGCGHYNYGYCRHPAINGEVDPNTHRCQHSREREVQDIDATEMQRL